MYYIAHLVIEAALAVLLVCSAFVIIVAIKRAVTRPARDITGVRVLTVIAARGCAEGLEQAVRTRRGPARTVVILDCGLRPEARRLAELLSRDYDGVELCAPDDFAQLLEDSGWTGENTYA